jgi:GTP cyclohydrolase II/3,4-dihydroxy 2-butanone 4-phosphate synthase/GTP cyclohydrolase II
LELLESCPVPIRVTTRLRLECAAASVTEQALCPSDACIVFSHEAEFIMHVFADLATGDEHIALLKPSTGAVGVPIRVHSSCVTAESFHAANCDCEEQLEMALCIADKAGEGGVLWLCDEGRGNGLAAKAVQLRLMAERALDTCQAYVEAGYSQECRDFRPAAEMLNILGIQSINLITNNPEKLRQVTAEGIEIADRIPCQPDSITVRARQDLDAKRAHLGHLIS